MKILRTMKTALTTMLAISTCLAGCSSSSSNGTQKSGPQLTPEQEVATGALCTKLESCSLVTASQMQQCKTQMAGALQIIPDPDAFATCVNGLTCADLQDSSSSKIVACVDFDRTSYVCSDSSTLYGCTNAGKCGSVSCTQVCSLMGYTFDHCGASNDANKAANVCWCRA
jgi:hypothetical protein